MQIDSIEKYEREFVQSEPELFDNKSLGKKYKYFKKNRGRDGHSNPNKKYVKNKRTPTKFLIVK